MLALMQFTVGASTIHVSVEDMNHLRNALNYGRRTGSKSWYLQSKHEIMDSDEGQKNSKPEQRDDHPGDAIRRSGDRVPDSNLGSLNKPISLWGAVKDPDRPVEVRSAGLNEPIGLWNACRNSRLPFRTEVLEAKR